MKVNMNVDIKHLTRVEGHGNISFTVKDGKLLDSRWEVVETARFFEGMLKGMSCEKANCIIPTTQNNANIHYDLAALVQQEVDKGRTDVEIGHLCGMLVRAYDPCSSCSVH